MPAVGTVYVLFNEDVPGVVKVGMSADVERRIAELNSGAGVIGRWKLFGHVTISDMKLVETKAHERLRPHRFENGVGKEIFRCAKEHAASIVREVARNTCIKVYDDTFPRANELNSSAPYSIWDFEPINGPNCDELRPQRSQIGDMLAKGREPSRPPPPPKFAPEASSKKVPHFPLSDELRLQRSQIADMLAKGREADKPPLPPQINEIEQYLNKWRNLLDKK